MPVARQTVRPTARAVVRPETLPSPPAEEIRTASTTPRALTLGDALATGLMQNPDLLTVRGTASVGAAVVDTASVYPWNPFVQAQFLPQGHPFVPSTTPGATAGGANYYVWLMQRFELGHQRRYREESAIAAFGQVRWNIRQAELLNLAQTERLFFTGLYQRQLRDLAADTETLSRRLVEVVERRFQAGIATTLETANARVAARQAHRQYQLAESAYQAALLALRQQLGLPADTPLNLAGDLTQLEWQPIADVFCSMSQSGPIDPQRLAVEMAEARPDVMAARSGAAIARANLSLSKAARTPDVQAGPIYSTADNGTQYLGFRRATRHRRVQQRLGIGFAARNRTLSTNPGAPINSNVGPPTKPPRPSIATNGHAASSPNPTTNQTNRRPTNWRRSSRSSRPARPISSTCWASKTTC